jgi:hypothetical protein
MKKILLITVLGTLFAAGSAFGHCGTCGVGDEAHAEGAKSECKADCSKPCSDEKKADCKAECKKDCAKPCDAKEKAAAKPSACCPATKAAKPA